MLPRVRRTLEEEEVGLEIYRTEYPGHATEIVKDLEKEDGTLAVMGGDGTVREVMNGLASTSTPLGIVPAGMGNDLSRSLGVPRSIVEAARAVVHGKPVHIDMGADNGRLFNVMGVGFPSDVVATFVTMRNGFFRGSLAYLASVLRTLSSLETYELLLEIDGRKRECLSTAVFVMNSRYTGGGINLIPHADPTDGLLDVAIIKEVGRMELTLALQSVYRGEHVDHPKIEFLKASRIKIDAPEKMVKMIDGELEGITPAEIEIVPEARSVIVPALKAG